jgi:DNA-binding NarL/FixJ family response regulator
MFLMMVGIGIVEDHTEFRQSLEYLVSSVPEYHLTWSFSSAEEALNAKDLPDVILLDINLPGMKGIDAIPKFRHKYSEVKIIMLTILEDEHHIFEAIRNGADGYLLKKSTKAKILEAIRQVCDDGGALTPMVARQVMDFFRQKPKPEHEPILTPREKEILALITEGMINDMIAAKLYISVQTVRNHIKNIYDKLQVHSRAQVVAKAFKDRLV